MKMIAMLMLAADLNGQPLPDVVLLDFAAGYCQPCQQMVPVLQEMEQGGFPIRKIDITERPDLSRQFNVQRIPTFILMVEGQEVKRFVGLRAGSELRQEMNDAARKLALKRRAAAGRTGQPSKTEPAKMNERPEPERVTDAEKSPSGIRGIFEKMKDGLTGNRKSRDEMERPNYRGQSPEDTNITASREAAMRASVRIRLMDGRTRDSGTGTVVYSTAGRSTIVTCAHVFKEVSDDAAIVVDVFRDGEVLKYPAEVIAGDHNSDVAFLQIQNATPLPTVPIAGRLNLKKNEAVFSIGCNNGDLPTRLNMNVVDVDRYEGPENIVCTNAPIRGRSGGGVFNTSGELLGVCSGAFKKSKEGLYSGVKPIQSLARQHKLTYLFATGNPSFATAQTPSETKTVGNSFADDDALFEELSKEQANSFSDSDFENDWPDAANMGAQVPDPFAPAAQPTMSHMTPTSSQPEVTVIIDSKDPSKGKRVVVIPKPSPWLLELLTGEPSPSTVANAGTRPQFSATGTRQSVRRVPVDRQLPPAH